VTATSGLRRCDLDKQ